MAAALLVVSAVVAVLVGVRSTQNGGSQAPPSPATQEQLGLPSQALLSASMRRQPVIGWRVTASELGLPAGTVIRPLRNIGDRGYFLGITDEGWWVVGVDVTDGRRLFAPVWLGRSEHALHFDCFINGPTMLLCVRDGGEGPQWAWAVNTENGALSFNGPTGLRLMPGTGQPELVQVGDYVVAEVALEGVHGIGTHAELTWFVPGNGVLYEPVDWKSDRLPTTIASQGGESGPAVVFSVVNGAVLTPSALHEATSGEAITYPGGFGYTYRQRGDSSDQVAFFDSSGRALGRLQGEGALLRTSPDVPIVTTASQLTVSTLEGRQLLEIRKPVLQTYVRLIGTMLFVTSDERQRSWQEYDLRTGAAGKACDIEDLGFGYIASDGAVAVMTGRRTPAHAVDLATCDELWSIPGYPDKTVQEVWKVNTMLVGRAGETLFSLVPPP